MEHLSLKESAYRLIKEKLLNLEFEPGSRIREDLLAQEISMSRTPVREAINQLSAEGLVNNIPRKGIFVAQFSTDEINGLLDIREALEALAIEACIRKINKEQLKSLEDLVEDFKVTLEAGDYKKCNKLDSLFHLEIARVSENKKLIEFLNEIEDFMQIARFLEKKSETKRKNERTLQEHRGIIETIKTKDIKAAREAVSVNIQTMRANLKLNTQAAQKI
jgi:DNA-binding GntR family transcriptional regulator